MKTLSMLYQSRILPEYVYLLLDIARNYRKFKQRIGLNKDIRYENIFIGTIDQGTPDYLSPLLIEVNQANLASLDCWIEERKKISICSNVLFSSCSQKEISRHLKKYLTITLPDNKEALFRFYDPTVAKQLPVLLDNTDYQVFMEPFSAWWYSDFDGLFKLLPRTIEGD